MSAADQLYHIFLARDAVFAFGYALHRMFASNKAGGPALLANLFHTNFSGVSGDIVFDENGDR